MIYIYIYTTYITIKRMHMYTWQIGSWGANAYVAVFIAEVACWTNLCISFQLSLTLTLAKRHIYPHYICIYIYIYKPFTSTSIIPTHIKSYKRELNWSDITSYHFVCLSHRLWLEAFNLSLDHHRVAKVVLGIQFLELNFQLLLGPQAIGSQDWMNIYRWEFLSIITSYENV